MLAQVLERAGADPADQVGLGVGGDGVDDRDGEEGDDDRVSALVSPVTMPASIACPAR